jgi:hypothetical protein
VFTDHFSGCRESLKFVTNDKKFQTAVQEEFQHKVAKAMVGKLEGAVEHAVDRLRQNETLRAETTSYRKNYRSSEIKTGGIRAAR